MAYVECDECPRSNGCYEKCMKAKPLSVHPVGGFPLPAPADTVQVWHVGNPEPSQIPAQPWKPVPPQEWPQPRQPSPEEAEEYREAYFRDFLREMTECGIVEMHEAAPSGQRAFTATREQWLSFFHKLEGDAANMDD